MIGATLFIHSSVRTLLLLPSLFMSLLSLFNCMRCTAMTVGGEFVDYSLKNCCSILRASILQMIPFLVITAAFLPGITCLLGYDCGGSTFNVSSISLLDVDECRDFDDRANSTSTYIQLLQVAEYSQTRVLSCRIEIDRQIFYCGMHSHISLVQGGHRKYLVDLDQAACARLHTTRTFIYGQGSVVTELQPNTTNFRTLTLGGSTGVDGTCHGGQFSDTYGTWHNVIVEASIYINFREYQATIRANQDLLLLRTGARCRASDLSCVDDDGANVFWSPLPDDKCQFHAYDVLYQGFANRIIDKSARYPTVYSLTSDKITFALSKKTERHVCGYTLIQTEHPKLLIVETSRDNLFAKQERILVENLDSFVYFNSKLVYVEKHIKTQIQDLYRNVINQKCSLERQVLKNAITTAFSQPDLFAYHLMKGPGYIAVIAGEVAHIVKCVPVDVARRPTDDCFLELPVTFSNISMFLTPKTRILRKIGTPVDCNPLLPIMYNVKGGWMSLTPKPAAALPPETLEPLVQPTWKYTDAEHLAENGIYTADDLSRLREHIMFPIEQKSLMNNFAKAAAGHRVPAGGISLTNLLDDNTLDYITQSATEKLFGGFIKFGTFTAGLIGLWMIVKIVKIIADTLIHGYALHSVYGWSIHLLGAIFSSITSLLLHLGRSAKRTSPPNRPNPNTRSSCPKPDIVIDVESRNLDPSAPTPQPSTSTSTLYPNIKSELIILNNSLTNLEKKLLVQPTVTRINEEEAPK